MNNRLPSGPRRYLTATLRRFCWSILALLFAGVSPARAQSDRLVIGISQFPATLHPGIEAMMAKVYVLGLARRPLTAYDADWKLVCFLCETLPTLENGLARRETTPGGKPGVAVTFRLKEGARWGDGVPVSSRDIVFTWQVGHDPRSGVAPGELYRRILRVETVDDQTVIFHFDRLTYDYNDLSGFEILPAHLEAEPFSQPEAYRSRTLYVTKPTEPGLYNGPYRITEVSAGSHIILTRNETWTGPRPAFSQIVVRTIENTAALEANLLSGSIDMIAGEIGLTLDQAIAFEKRHGDRFTVLFKPGLAFEHIDLNLNNSILQDRRVRQALLFAVDRQGISDRLFAGRQPVANSFVHPLDANATTDLPTYSYDPAKAAALLDAAGWTLDDKGQRRNAAHQPLALEIMTTAGDRTRELVEQVLQEQWRKIGIDISIRNQPARVFFGESVSHRQFPAMAMFAWISAPDNVPRTILHSEEIPSPANGFSGQNYTGYANPKVDALLGQIEVEMDPVRRRDLMREVQQIYVEDLPALPLYFRANAFVLPKDLSGVRPTGHQFPTTLWVEDWHRP